MNHRLRTLSIGIACAFIMIAGCSSDDDTKVLTGSYGITGHVVTPDGTGISNATVVLKLDGVDIADKLTGQDGSYTFDSIPLGMYTVLALSDGYTYGQTAVAVTADGSSVKNLVLTRLSAIVNRVEQVKSTEALEAEGLSIDVSFDTPAGGTGGTGSVTQSVTVTIPPGANMTIGGGTLTGDVTFAATPLQLNQVPEAPAGELQMGTLFLQPVGATFDKPVAVTIPLGIRMTPGSTVPLKRFENEQWVTYGSAVVDASGFMATASITEFGQIAIQPPVTVTTTNAVPTEETVETIDIPLNTQESVSFTVSSTISFPAGLPDGVTQEFVEAMVQKLNSSPTGSQTLTVALPTYTSAKPALVMAPAEVEAFNTWRVTLMLNNEERTITITIPGDTFDISYLYQYYEPVITRVELAHSSGTGT